MSPRPWEAGWTHCGYQLSKIGNNLNQLARAANTAGQVVALELLERALQELRAALPELTA